VKRLVVVALGLMIAALAATVRIVPADRAGEPKDAVQAGTGSWAIPVAGVTPAQLQNNWHDAREGGARVHEGLDITAPRGTPVLSAIAGRVEKVFDSERGGITLYVRTLDGASMAYYAHLAGYYPGTCTYTGSRPGTCLLFFGPPSFGCAEPGEPVCEGSLLIDVIHPTNPTNPTNATPT